MHPKIFKVGNRPAYLNLLLFGPSGVGKTTFGATSGRPLFVDVEQGTTALSVLQPDSPIHVWTVREFDEIWEVLDYLRDGGGVEEFDTVVLDSYTDLVAKCLESVVTEADEREKRKLSDAAELRDHGRVLLKMGKVLRRFRDLPVDVILICLDRVPAQEAADRRLGPDLPPRLANNSISYMDAVCYMVSEEETDSDGGNIRTVRKYLLNSPSGQIRVKERFGAFNAQRRGLRDVTFPEMKAELLNGKQPNQRLQETAPKGRGKGEARAVSATTEG